MILLIAGHPYINCHQVITAHKRQRLDADFSWSQQQ